VHSKRTPKRGRDDCPDHKGFFPEIFDLYVTTGADFVDCCHAVLARELRMNRVVTLDRRHFKRFGFIPYGCP